MSDLGVSNAKRMRVTPRIGTHSGKFHCDEALACYMLQSHVTQFKDGEIVRSRDSEVHETVDILVDVGGEYDPARNRYDHHQRGFEETFSEKFNRTKLSSAGLIYKHFGREVIADILRTDQLDDQTLETLYDKMYETFVEAIDGVDNGVNQYDGEPKYQSSTDLGSRVAKLGPWWNQECSEEEMMTRFHSAMALTGTEFRQKVEFLARCWWPARAIVVESLEARFDVHQSGEIILLKTFCPWKKHLFELEEAQGLGQNIKYCVFPSNDGSFRVQAVPLDRPDNFQNRKPLPQAWRGVRDADLSDVAGIPDCIFVHSSGFIGGARNMDSALQMAIYSQEN